MAPGEPFSTCLRLLYLGLQNNYQNTMTIRGLWRGFKNKLSITNKFALAFSILILLIAQVAITAFSSLNAVIQETEVAVFNSVEIQSLVYKMDASLQNARNWERNFFFYWQSVGFNKAQEDYQGKHKQEIDRVIGDGSKLKAVLDKNNVSTTLNQSGAVVSEYLELVNQYSQNFRQVVSLVGDLGLDSVGQLAQLKATSLRLQERLRLAEVPELIASSQEIETRLKSYLTTRQATELQGINDILQRLRERIVISAKVNPAQRSLVISAGDDYQEQIKRIIGVFQEIDSKFTNFDAQTAKLSQQLIDLAAQEINRAQGQITRTNNLSKVLLMAAVVGAITVAGVIAQLFFSALKNLQAEQEKSEQLLLNILPMPIAHRLKQQEQTIADDFPSATVLFADIVGFTELSGEVSPIELVEILNVVFSEFDYLAEKHSLEKIKTIGDAYMVVGGLPTPSLTHAEAIAHMALDMLDTIEQFAKETGKNFQIRIGINTGPVIAGVIGTKKYIYDLWGDTVNIASRMESQGLPGKIQVTTAAYHLLKQQFDLESRGLIDVKGKGQMECYLLIGRRNH